MSKLQDFVKQVGQEKWNELNGFVQKVNSMIGNDEVRIVLGDGKAIFYHGTAITKYDYEPSILETFKDRTMVAFSDGRKEWRDTIWKVFDDCADAEAWPEAWQYTEDYICITVKTGANEKNYAFNRAGWLALVDDVCSLQLDYHGRRVKDAL